MSFFTNETTKLTKSLDSFIELFSIRRIQKVLLMPFRNFPKAAPRQLFLNTQTRDQFNYRKSFLQSITNPLIIAA
jgi:hypothetical protein